MHIIYIMQYFWVRMISYSYYLNINIYYVQINKLYSVIYAQCLFLKKKCHSSDNILWLSRKKKKKKRSSDGYFDAK